MRRDLSYESIEAWLKLGMHFGTSRRLVPILCWLLADDGHHQHEELADALQDLRDPRSVDCLFDRTRRPLDYLDYNDGEALAVKCIWALHDIATTQAAARLRELSGDARDAVAQRAKRKLAELEARDPGAPDPDYRLARNAQLGAH